MKKEIEILKNYILYFLVFIVICLVGVSGVFALTTKTIYSDLALSNSNKYNYGYTNAGGIDDVATGTVGTRINGKTKYIGFYLSETTSLNYTYTIRINFLSDDLQPYFSLNYVRRIETCNSSSCSNASIVAIRKQNNNGYSTWVELDFNPTQTGSKIGVVLGNDNGNYITGETYFGISSVQIESKNANQDVINNATNNTNNIINNNNSNTENIINNNDENTQKIIDSNKVCSNKTYDKTSLKISGYLTSSGTIASSNDWKISEYINILQNETYTLSLIGFTSGVASYCLYDDSKNLISCTKYNSLNTFSISSNVNGYIRYCGRVNTNDNISFTGNICMNGQQALNDSINEQKNAINGLNDSINNDDSSGATSEASEFFSSFTTNTFGLTSIITAPLNLIQSLTSSTCSELHLPLPYLDNKYLDLPCMTSIYQTHFGSFFTMYQTITYGIIAYWVCVRIFNQVKDFKNPEHDEIEVVDL